MDHRRGRRLNKELVVFRIEHVSRRTMVEIALRQEKRVEDNVGCGKKN